MYSSNGLVLIMIWILASTLVWSNIIVQGVPTSLEWTFNVMFWSSEMIASNVYKKIEKCILLQKIAFPAFFPELQNENGFLK